ncbi:MAG: hypothetical protein WD045_09600 [Pirellulaceae bacterium]
MFRVWNTRPRLSMLLVLGIAAVISGTGCAFMANMLHPGDMRTARFTGLEEKTVAVICVSSPSFYSQTTTSRQIAEAVESLLSQRVKEIKIIPQQKIDDWKDRVNWDSMDYREAGKGLKADMVVAIDLASFEIQPNPGVFRGNAEYVVSVYDIKSKGKVVFQDTPRPIQFPANGLVSTTSSEREFRSSFMNLLAHRIARNFYGYNGKDDLMLDETFVSG